MVGLTSPEVQLSNLSISTEKGFADTITDNSGTPFTFRNVGSLADPAEVDACPKTVVVRSTSPMVTSMLPVSVYMFE